MRPREEALERAVWRKALELGLHTRKALEELRLSVRADLASYATAPAERALLVLAQALDTAEDQRTRDDFLDDDQYRMAFMSRMGQLTAACENALAADPECLDAQLLLAIATPQPLTRWVGAVEEALARARELDVDAPEAYAAFADPASWENVFARPRLRALAALARWNLLLARHRTAIAYARELLDACPASGDPLGARYTLALAYARLEDEPALEELDRAFGRQGNAWLALARTLLLYKLDRLAAARRALAGYVRVYEAGAFALANPTFVEPYLPDRPRFEPGSLDEVVLAVHEAEPVIVDTPDFINWCHEQPGFTRAAESYARRMGFDEG